MGNSVFVTHDSDTDSLSFMTQDSDWMLGDLNTSL